MSDRRILWIALFTTAAVGYLMMFARAIEVHTERFDNQYINGRFKD